jgi:hypothetical protein
MGSHLRDEIAANEDWFPAHRSNGRSQETRLVRTAFDFVQPLILELIGERGGLMFGQQIVEIREIQCFLLAALGEQW